jgi:hypothetical protein
MDELRDKVKRFEKALEEFTRHHNLPATDVYPKAINLFHILSRCDMFVYYKKTGKFDAAAVTLKEVAKIIASLPAEDYVFEVLPYMLIEAAKDAIYESESLEFVDELLTGLKIKKP